MKPIPRSSLQALTLLEILISTVLIGVMMVLLIGGYGQVRTSFLSTSCVSNLKALHQMLNQYANEHRNCYPPGYAGSKVWIRELNDHAGLNHGSKEGIAYCPATRVDGKGVYERDINTWRTDYNINRFVASEDQGKNNRSSLPGHLVLLFDGSGAIAGSASTSKEAKRHRDGFNVVFVDGHVEFSRDITQYSAHWRP